MRDVDELRKEIMKAPENMAFTELGWQPIFQAPPTARILIASQAPGLKAQESAPEVRCLWQLPWHIPGHRSQILSF